MHQSIAEQNGKGTLLSREGERDAQVRGMGLTLRASRLCSWPGVAAPFLPAAVGGVCPGVSAAFLTPGARVWPGVAAPVLAPGVAAPFFWPGARGCPGVAAPGLAPGLAAPVFSPGARVCPGAAFLTPGAAVWPGGVEMSLVPGAVDWPGVFAAVFAPGEPGVAAPVLGL